jgi:predicted ferric reductase
MAVDRRVGKGEGPSAPAVRVILFLSALWLPLLTLALFGPATDHGFVDELGKSLALLGFMLLALQFVLSARFKWIERPFGLDMIFHFHRQMGIFAIALLSIHPLLLAAGGEGWSLLNPFEAPPRILLGQVSLVVLWGHVLASLLRRSLELGFESWRRIHNLGALLVLTGGLVHSWLAGGDLGWWGLRTLWVVVFAVALVAYGHHRILRPWLLRRNAYEVTVVHKEARNVFTLTLAPAAGGRRFDFLPGQFHFLTLRPQDRHAAEEHPFTISSSPTAGNLLASTVKRCGDFTASIGETRVGDRVSVHGPFGRFSYVLHPDETDLVFIAGGIGITPLMSMLRHMRDCGARLEVLLLYASRTEPDVAFQDELAEMERGAWPRLKVVRILSRASSRWRGEKGHVDRERIHRLCGADLSGKAFYVCGPEPMMTAVAQTLRQLGVETSRIHWEKFSL